MIDKLKNKIFSLTVVLSFLSSIIIGNIVNAVENIEHSKELPEIEIGVDHTGIRVSETVGEIKKNENVLTRISDVLLEGSKIYTYDSKTENKLHGAEPGKSLIGNMGCLVRDSAGNRIESLDIDVQVFINVNKEAVAEGLYSDLGYLQGLFNEQEFKKDVVGVHDIISSRYGTYMDKRYNLTIDFKEDGTFELKIPEDMPDNYMLSITAVEDPITGEKIDTLKLFRLFIALGDGSNSEGKDHDGDYPGDDNTPESDDGHRYYSVTSSTTNYTDLEPEISASIYSDKYDVLSGIPTSENLTYSLKADNALYNITTRATTVNAGVKGITIKLSATYPQKHTKIEYNESGDEIETTWTTTETVSKTVSTDFSYDIPAMIVYDVPTSNIYPVQTGALQAVNGEYTLSSGGLTLNGSAIKYSQLLNVTAQLPKVEDTESENIGHFKSYTAAVKALNNNDGTNVKNRIKTAVHAAVGYTGNVNYDYYGLKLTSTTNNNVKPTVEKVNSASTKLIPSTYANGTYKGSGNVLYAGAQKFNATPNNVIIHTPVVNNAYISNVSEFINQKINKDSTRTYLMLDEQFTITIPNNGVHNNIKGYGNRTYNTNQGVAKASTTWGKIKDIKLPFDAYLHYKKNNTTYKYFIKANTWLSDSGASNVIALTKNTYTFTIPVWVTEKTYEIETRIIAENATDAEKYALVEEGKNSDIKNYVATKTIPVEIIGKIYDLRVSSSNDPGWSSIYSWKNATNYITAEEFPFGAAGQNQNTAYKYAPKLGYTFVFDFKTKGTKSNNIDVSIQPEGFYFVSKDGKKTQEVDLYYNTISKNNIKITPTDKNIDLIVNLKNNYMKVAAQEFVDSTRIYNSKYNYSIGVKVGTFAKMNLPHNLRLCYNNFNEYVNALYGKGSTVNSISNNAGNKDTVIGSVGHWYAGYRLPASTKAIPVGTDINTAIKNKTYLTDGYILVKFDIKTKYQNTVGNYDYLQYMGPEALNEAGENLGILNPDWTKNGTQTITLPNGNTAKVPVGAVAIFDAALRSSNDAEVGGTH